MTKQRLRVYIAGPITKGDLEKNLRQAREAGTKLIKAGFAPFIPQLTAFLAGDTPERLPAGTTHDDWMGVDLPWVAVCDVLLRLPGESDGADQEERYAKALGIPVYYYVDDLISAPPPPKYPPILHPSSRHFESLLEELRQVHRKKAADYGTDEDPFKNIRSAAEIGISPWLGCWLRFKDKVRRGDTFCRKRSLANEGFEDTLIDAAAYALISLVMFREEVSETVERKTREAFRAQIKADLAS